MTKYPNCQACPIALICLGMSPRRLSVILRFCKECKSLTVVANRMVRIAELPEMDRIPELGCSKIQEITWATCLTCANRILAAEGRSLIHCDPSNPW